MIRNFTIWQYYAATVLVAFTMAAVATAQPPDAAGQADTPAKTAPKRKLGESSFEAALEPVKVEPPAVLAVMESNPKTPADVLRAAALLIDLGRPELAKPFIRQLGSLTKESLAELPGGAGKADLLKLSLTPEVAPEGKQLADAALAAFEEWAKNPQRLAAAVSHIADPNPVVRTAALEVLRAAGNAAAPPLLAAFLDEGHAAQRPYIREALVLLSANTTDALLGVLESDDDALKAQIIDILGRSRNAEVIPYLMGPATSPKSGAALRTAAESALERLTGHTPHPHEAEEYLRNLVKEYYDRRREIPTNAAGQVELWRWDSQHRTSVLTLYSPAQASAIMAARLGDDLLELGADERAYQRWYLASLLESAAYQAGVGNPLQRGTAYAVAASQSPDTIEDVLNYAISTDHPVAATAAAQVLGNIGGVDMLSRTTKPSPLALAARNPDRRLRMAAVEAILKLQPNQSFPGSSYVPEALGYFVSAGGDRKVIVGHPRVEVAQALAALLMQLGYDAVPVTSGREMFKAAAETPDVELILMSDGMENPLAGMLLQDLRRDKRTGKLPIGVLAGLNQLDHAKEIVSGDPLTEASPEPRNLAGMRILVERLLDRAGTGAVLPAERKQQAIRAIAHLAALSKGSQKLYDLRRQEPAIQSAVFVPTLTQPATVVLGALGTASGQRALVELASRSAQPIEARREAVAAFGQSVSRYGLRLTREEILRQYERYNQSESADADTQNVLSAVLDWIEMPSKTTLESKQPTSKR